jgi:hypothetical protein
VLGLTQGYNNLLYESDKSFAKAEELGFKIWYQGISLIT